MPSFRSVRRRALVAVLAIHTIGTLSVPGRAPAQESAKRIPTDTWLRYADPTDAGFDPELLEDARRMWDSIPSSAFLVIADGAVVAAWGDIERRFMCHSVRKSFLTGLYGVYWDRGEIELNKTLADLGIDDEPEPLLESEKQARILDLLKARSGVFHPAAYAGRTDTRPRGSEGPGRFFAYNNWDFNTAAAILMQETGIDVFEAFDEHFAAPLGMQDWRISDGYYHYERDKSRYPAYPFRMSARDMARFGLLYAREGVWGDERIVSQNWVRQSSALYSIDNEDLGYGFMWWIFRQPPFADHGMYAALGVGNQMIAVLPESDLVIVNRANTYEGEGTPAAQLQGLIRRVLAARTGAPVADPALTPLEALPPDPGITSVPDDRLSGFAGEWAFPPSTLGLPGSTTLTLSVEDGHLRGHLPVAGTFRLYLQPDGTFHVEDRRQRMIVLRDGRGAFVGLADEGQIGRAAIYAAADGRQAEAVGLADLLADSPDPGAQVTGAVVALLGEDPSDGEARIKALVTEGGQDAGFAIARRGMALLQADRPEAASRVFELNSRMFPDVPATWRQLGDARRAAGDVAGAARAYEKVLDLEPGDEAAKAALEELARPAG